MRTALAIAAILLAYGLVGAMDYRTELAIQIAQRGHVIAAQNDQEARP